ncbi:putative spermidine/putrescine transport system permease protein [Mesorhizobium sp. J18]|uniref:ABC transporter permease n=1 Tax=Mesorhizobium sp. J18 TaxID=935263 RepID=UPI00119AE937|nr:ABC transporter permease [Mesorhizobium sp. J18]TWG91791.1 putative spermidine/putrescine transport system permease protein [Mesorhizobium sp. J18]
MHKYALSRRGWLLLLIPPLIVLGLLYLLPVFNLIRISFVEYDPQVGIIPNYQLGNYVELLGDGFYFEVLWRTIRLSLLTTLFCALLGYPIAVYLIRSTGWRQTAMFIILLMPLVTSVTVMSYGWLILLGRNGVINLTLAGLGILDTSRQLMYNETAIVVGLVHVLVVFMVISIAASLQSIDQSWIRAARGLGASPATAFRTITFPLSLPGLRTGALLVFVLSMSAYATPTLLGGTRHKFLSYLVYQQAISLYNWPSGAAMAVVLLISTTVLLFISSLYAQIGAMRANLRTSKTGTISGSMNAGSET